MMGGKIIVQSKYGEGTKFTVCIAQKIISMEKEIKEEAIEVKLDLSGKKVLLVDDNKLNIKIATRILSEYNLTINEALSGEEALEIISNGNDFDIILLDDMMPKMSGTETLAKLKENPKFNIPVIVLTANAIDGMKEKYIASGFNDYLSKPIERNELSRVLNTYLGQNAIKNKVNFEPLPSNIYDITNDDVDKINDITKDYIEEKVVTSEILTEEVKNNIEKQDNLNLNNEDYLINNGIDVDSGLELLGDKEMYDETLSGFLDESADRLPKMKEFMEVKDTDNYAILAHAMKSDSKYLGFKVLAQLSLEHELKGKAGDIEFIDNNFQSLMNEANKIIDIVKNYLGR